MKRNISPGRAFLLRCSVCLLVVGLCLITAGQRARAGNLQQNHATSVPAKAHSVDQQVITSGKITLEKLVGRWNRTDGNYILEIIPVKKSKTVRVAYYNPKPIHIAQTKITSQNKVIGAIKIFIKLQDKGYPGSTYTLHYIPSDDVLKGTYFHAGLQQQFPSLFIREKKETP